MTIRYFILMFIFVTMYFILSSFMYNRHENMIKALRVERIKNAKQ